MTRSLQGAMLLATLLSVFAYCAAAQPPGPEPKKKVEPSKPSDLAKGKDAVKVDAPKSLPTTIKPRLPSNALIFPGIDLEEALTQWPQMMLMSRDYYQQLVDKLAAQEKQLKPEKVLAHSCKLTGKLDGDHIAVKAEFLFSTESGRSMVLLGLQKAHLTDDGILDGQPASLDYSEDEGFFVNVKKEGSHHLTLDLRVQVSFKKTTVSGGVERGFDLGLPGTAVTTLALELPGLVKEVRWNENTERTRTPGRWQLALGKSKSLNLSWREPVVAAGAGPVRTADGKIHVLFEETHVAINAELTIEDRTGKTKEWHLLLPQGARVEVKSPATAFELMAPDGKNRFHVLRLAEPSAEPWSVAVLLRMTRPAPGVKLPIGPFVVNGAYHQGTITVQHPTESVRWQRVLYHRFGDVFQRDQLKDAAPAGSDAVQFQYWSLPPVGKKGAGDYRVPLEIELRNENGMPETSTTQTVRLRSTNEGWEVDLTQRIQLNSLHGTGETLGIHLPRPRLHGVGALSVAPVYPMNVPWPALWHLRGEPAQWAVPLDFQASEEGGGVLELTAPDSQGKTRVSLPRGSGKPFILVLKGKYAVPSQNQRVRLDLPRLSGVIDRGAKVTVQTDSLMELLVGPKGLEEPVPEKHRYLIAMDDTPSTLDLAWRKHRPEFAVDANTDVMLHERSAQIRHVLRFKMPGPSSETVSAQLGHVQLQIPEAVRRVNVMIEGRSEAHEATDGYLWVLPTRNEGDRVELYLEYDVALPQRKETDEPELSSSTFAVPLIWPQLASRKEAHLRVWSESGTRVRLAQSDDSSKFWKDRGVEAVPARNVLPALVARGSGDQLPLSLTLERAPQASFPALLCDRALIQVVMDEERSQSYRARYLIRKIQARFVDVEFPLAVAECGLAKEISIGAHKVAWEPVPGAWNVARIRLQGVSDVQPVLLDLEYKLPTSFQEGKQACQTTFYPPRFLGRVVMQQTRWQAAIPPSWIAAMPAGTAETFYRWGIRGYLLSPETSLSSGESETWLTGQEAREADLPITLTARASHEPQRLFHLPRLIWFILCSGSTVLLFLALIFVPLPRSVRWCVVALLSVATLVSALNWPGIVPVVVMGMQPALFVIALLLVIHWLVQERYRRQVVFIPGFTRGKSELSVVHSSRSKGTRDASTVDAPASADVAEPAVSGSKLS